MFLLGLVGVIANNNEELEPTVFSTVKIFRMEVPKGNEKVGWYQAKQGILELRNGSKKRAPFCGQRKTTKILKLIWNLGSSMEPLIRESI